MQISAPFQIFVRALTLVWNAFKRRAYLSRTNLKVIYSLQVPGRFSYPLHAAHYPYGCLYSVLALRSAPDYSGIHLSPCRHLLCAPEQTALRGGVPRGVPCHCWGTRLTFIRILQRSWS